MNKLIKTFGSRILFGMACFNLGGYVTVTVRGTEIVEPYRWVMTSLCLLMFLVYTFDKE